MPGQKLKVKIPKKADMEKRNFVVSVPAPKVTGELRENNFSKVRVVSHWILSSNFVKAATHVLLCLR